MTTQTTARLIQKINSIPYTNPNEAQTLMETAFERLMHVVETLKPGDWAKPTACTEWDVRAMLAHQAGGFLSGTGYIETFRLMFKALPKQGELPEDAANALQVSARAGYSQQELIAELRHTGPIAARKWAHAFRIARLVSIPHPVMNPLPLRHLFWVIHSRDTWMHRLDICRATGIPFHQTVEHDGRIAALVMLDVVKCLKSTLNGRPMLFDLSGIAGGLFQAGEGEPAAILKMDVLDFNNFASGRYSYEVARELMEIQGDIPFAEAALKKLIVLY